MFEGSYWSSLPAGLVLAQIPGGNCSSLGVEHLVGCCSLLMFCTGFK